MQHILVDKYFLKFYFRLHFENVRKNKNNGKEDEGSSI